MRLFRNKLIMLLLYLFLLPDICLAGIYTQGDITVNIDTLSYPSQVIEQMPGTVIGEAWNKKGVNSYLFDCHILGCTDSSVKPAGNMMDTGMKIDVDGNQYTVYQSGVKGLGFIVRIRDHQKLTYTPLNYGEKIINYAGKYPYLGWTIEVTFVKTSNDLQPGSKNIERMAIVELGGYINGILSYSGRAYAYLNPGTLSVATPGCTVTSPGSVFVTMGSFNKSSFPAVGSTAGKQPVEIQLLCGADVTVKAVLTDQSNQTNISNVVSLTSDSTAEGVGVQFIHNDKTVKLGSTGMSEGAYHQFFVGGSTKENKTITIQLNVQYIRTDEITPGTANSIAGITFSYQ